MRIMTVLLLLVAVTVFAANPYIDPSTRAMRVFDIPIGARHGLAFHTDTMHVTTSEQGWGLAVNCVGFTLINPNANHLLWRISNVSGVIQCYLGNYGTLDLYPPGMIKKGNGLDSLFIDGEAACTVYLYYWSQD